MTSPSTPNTFAYPKMRIITDITRANPCVITLTQAPQYVVDQFVRVKVPSGWGMPQINGKIGVITATDDVLMTVTIDLDSSQFDAFVYPPGGYIAGNGFIAQLIPVGDAEGQLAFPFDNLGPNPVIP